MIKSLASKCLNFSLMMLYMKVSHFLLTKLYVHQFEGKETPSVYDLHFNYLSMMYPILMITIHSIYYILYNMEWTKKFKSNDIDFPWEINKEQWLKDLPEIIKVYVKLTS